MKRISTLTSLGALLAIVVALGAAPFAHARKAPEFAGITHWINSPPLTMKALRGKVVLIDFWTYSCINCLRALPHVTHWYDTYKDKGLVVVGVSTPEFDFEKKTANVKKAVKQFGIHYPVAQDNNMATWNAWRNRFWPAEYLVDQHGDVVKHHYGEGHYLEMENAIRKLLGMKPLTKGMAAANLDHIGSPEMYLGSARVDNLANAKPFESFSHHYQAPATLPLNQYALQGSWSMHEQYAEATGADAALQLHFRAAKVNMVASSEQPVTLSITVDGKPQPPVTVNASKLYTLFKGAPGQHMITISTPKAGLHAFTFTFG